MGLLDIFRRKSKQMGVRTLNIEDDGEIRRRLTAFCEQRKNCDFLIGEELFSSIFLKLEENNLLTDLMIPLAGNTLLREGTGVRVGFLDRRIPYIMNCVYLGRKVEEGFESLSFSLPTLIRYSNRRAYYRVTPSAKEPVRVLFDLGMSQIQDAHVEDISGGGLAVRSALTNYLQPGAKIDRVDVILPNSEWISCKGEVIRLQGRLVGIQLLDITFNDRRSIIRYVAGRQQNEISKSIE